MIAASTFDLSKISAEEILTITETVAELLDVVATSGVTATALSANLATQAGLDKETLGVITSTAASGKICGTVTDSASSGIENVLIVVRDYGNWVTRAKTKTAADGGYCLIVPVTGETDAFTGGTLSGEYIVGAINRTGQTVNPLKSASECYTSTTGARTQFEAEKVTVANATPVNGIDFELADGARISGVVTTHDAGSAEGIQIELRDYNTFVPIASARVKSDNTYRVSVPDGDYLVMAVNKTLRPYATTVYTANSAYDHAREGAARITVNVGDAQSADFTLQAGNLLSGSVLDTPSGSAVQGMRARVNLPGNSNFGGTAARLRTQKNGGYRIWLKPDIYDVDSRGQAQASVDLSSGSVANVDFIAQQGTVSGTLLDGNSNPVSQAKQFLYTADTSNATNYAYNLVSQELSNSDGSFDLYATTGSAYKLLVRFDESTSYASMVYTGTSGTTTINGGDNITVTTGADTALGTITLPTQGITGGVGAVADGAGILSGTVSVNGTTGLAGGQLVEVRATATNNTARFLTARTRGDGTYTVPLPVNSAYRVRFINSTNQDSVAITDGNTTTVNQ
jgi:hypothetical protein